MILRNGSASFVRLLVLVSVFTNSAACEKKKSIEVEAPPPANTVVLTKAQLAQMKIATAGVDLQDVDDTVLASGKITFDDQKVMHVFSPVAGKVTNIFAQLGSRVKKSDPLVTIESPDIGVATSDVRKAKADLIAVEHEFARQKELLELHAASQRDYEAAANNYRQAKAEMERAEQKAALFRRGDVVGQSFTLRSDIDGEVFMKGVSPGMQVAGQYGGGAAELFTIGEADRVWVISDIFELDIPRIKVGAKAVVSVVSWPNRNFEGTVDWVSAALDPTTHAAKVRCTFDNSDGALKPEMFATVRISADVRKAIAVPRPAVLRLGEQTVVFVDRGSDELGRERFEGVPVTVDEGEGDKWLAVTHGLEKGERVVTEGAILLSGML